MQKRYFWGLEAVRGRDTRYVHRFRTGEERKQWSLGNLYHSHLSATDPEVRRIQRRLAAGEEVIFPVEVTP